MSIGGKYWMEALDTLAAPGWQIWLARTFGEKIVGEDEDFIVTMYKFRGTAYMTDLEEKEKWIE